MKCKKCGSENVKIYYVSTGSSTKVICTSLVRKIVRFTLIFVTCGLWCFVPKRKENVKTKVKHKKMAVCQDCGNVWNV